MDFIQQVKIWTKGDVIQGKWMIGIAIIILLPICVAFMKSINSLQKGMVIPICLLLLMNIGYGGYLLFSKPKNIGQIENEIHINAKETLQNEIDKIQAANISYTLTKYVWAAMMVISVVLYFLFTKEYYQGLSLGFLSMFFGMLLIDTFLSNRLKHYLLALQEIFNQTF